MAALLPSTEPPGPVPRRGQPSCHGDGPDRSPHDGHDVASFTSGAEALEALSQRSFDVVVTDLDMPGVTGVQVVQGARARLPSACIVVVSARGHQMERALLDAGASLVVEKPVDYDRLMQAVEAARARSPASAPVRSPRDAH